MESGTKIDHWKQGRNAHVRPDEPIECERRKQSMATQYSTEVQQKETTTLLNEVSVPSNFGQNNTEIKKMTK